MLDYINDKRLPMTNTLAFLGVFVSYKEKKGCECGPRALYFHTIRERERERETKKKGV